MSHEFRTHLNAIIGFTGILLMKLPGPITADQEKHLRIIQSGGRHLLSLTDGLMGGADTSSAVTIPSESLSMGERQPKSIPEKRTENARILLIEDDPNSRKLMVYLLKGFGHEPLIAEDGEQGLAMARAEMPDLILCDLQLPNLSGYEVARELKRGPRPVPDPPNGGDFRHPTEPHPG